MKKLKASSYQRVCIDIIESDDGHISKVRFNLFPNFFGRTITREREVTAKEAASIDRWLNKHLGPLL